MLKCLFDSIIILYLRQSYHLFSIQKKKNNVLSLWWSEISFDIVHKNIVYYFNNISYFKITFSVKTLLKAKSITLLTNINCIMKLLSNCKPYAYLLQKQFKLSITEDDESISRLLII